jgi:dinuclear metal center YbgI/SA1388 family protein
MASLSDIVAFSDELLAVSQFKDYCPNGLQVEGRSNVNKIITGVTASQALIDGAIKKNADLILVHHGFFWRGEDQAIVGIKKNRIQALLQNDVSLLAYHLPLDAHTLCGNNVQLAKRLSLQPVGVFGVENNDLGVIVETEKPIKAKVFTAHIQHVLGRTPTHISVHGDKVINKVAICTGAAQGYFESAISAGVDAFITGEVSEQSYHLAIESGVDYFAAGHHATERYGVQALAELIVSKFSVEHEFLEISNPV